MLKNKRFTLVLITLVFFIFVNVVNLKNPILEQHSFRQTQTAISVFYLIKDGFTLNYITPVVGKTYSIPFEFPIYQFVVAFIAKYCGLSIDVSGRLISLLFGIGILAINNILLKEIGINRNARLFSFVLIVFAPIYLFWSGTFMIESSALFLAISSLLFVIKYARYQKNIYLILWFFLATLALLQKVTTAIFPYFIGCVVLIFLHLKAYKNSDLKITIFKIILHNLVVILPILIAYGWVLYTDILKSDNPIAVVKMTSTALTEWNYGNLTQRFSKNFWYNNIYIRAVAPLTLFGFGFIIIFMCLLDKSIKRHIKIVICVFLGLYLIPQLVFTNLFIVHDYYHYAVVIYLCNSIGIAYSYVNLNCYTKRLPFYLLLATCVCSIVFFINQYRHAKFSRIDDSYKTLAIAREIKNQTVPDDVFVIFGYDWSSEVAYYSERKSLAVPEWYLDKLQMPHIERYFDRFPKLIIVCNDKSKKYDYIISQMLSYSLQKELSGCLFFMMEN